MKSAISDYRHLLAWVGIESKCFFVSVQTSLHTNLLLIILYIYNKTRFKKNP